MCAPFDSRPPSRRSQEPPSAIATRRSRPTTARGSRPSSRCPTRADGVRGRGRAARMCAASSRSTRRSRCASPSRPSGGRDRLLRPHRGRVDPRRRLPVHGSRAADTTPEQVQMDVGAAVAFLRSPSGGGVRRPSRPSASASEAATAGSPPRPGTGSWPRVGLLRHAGRAQRPAGPDRRRRPDGRRRSSP